MAERNPAPGLMAEALGLAALRPMASPVVRLRRPPESDSRKLCRDLKSLRLSGMAQALEDISAQPGASLSFQQRLDLMLEKERQVRKERQLRTRVKQARLRIPARLEQVELGHDRSLDPDYWRQLSSCAFVERKQNLLLTGPTGVGKTFISCALADHVCRLGKRALYARLPQLLAEAGESRRKGNEKRFMAKLGRVDLLVLDDWGPPPVADQGCLDLREVADLRWGRGSTIVVSELPVRRWPEIFRDPSQSRAVLDRLDAGALRLELTGGSLRSHYGPEPGR